MGTDRSAIIAMSTNRGQLLPVRCQTAPPPSATGRRGRPYETERPHPREREVTQSIIMSQAHRQPRA
jgi:hypothetical protein